MDVLPGNKHIRPSHLAQNYYFKRKMLRKISWIFSLMSLLAMACDNSNAKASGETVAEEKMAGDSLPDCEWCGAMDAPEQLSWRTVIPPAKEPGEPLVIRGTVYLPDGATRAEGFLLYVYHTNAKGIYPKKGDETGNGKRHGYLRAWMKTDSLGRYEFRTIRPAPYPSREQPARIHLTLTGPDYPEHWIDAYWFAGDPLITPKMKARLTRPGDYRNITYLEKDEDGIWRGKRDIVLRKY